MDNFVKGYIADAAVDIIMDTAGSILPGFSRIKLPAHYKPAVGEVAIVSARTSTLNLGIFVAVSLIDPEYEGTISAWVFNASGLTRHYEKGDRLFSVVNLQLAPTRVKYNIVNFNPRGKNNIGSSGGQNE